MLGNRGNYLDARSQFVPPTFSLQDAIAFSGDPFASLYTSGCNQTDGVANCTAACSDQSQAFETLETLRNCVLYDGIANLYATVNDTFAVTWIDNDTNIADEFSIQKSRLDSNLSQSINSTLRNCFLELCNGSPDCASYATGTELPAIVELNTNGFADSGNMLCEYFAQPSPLNPDIGGIGVYVSYWIQSGLAVLGTCLALVWGWTTHAICFSGLSDQDGSKPLKCSQIIPDTFARRRLTSLTAALTDFQKAQCFFMLAVNIAALVNKVNGGLLPGTLQQLYDNYSLLASVAVSGYLPITTTLLALHMVDKVSGYLLVLSGCTVALSIAVVGAIGIFKPSPRDLDSIRTHALQGPHQCGGVDLSVYCLQYKTTIRSNHYVWGIMAYCVIILMYVFACYSHVFRDPRQKQIRPWVLRMISLTISAHYWGVAFAVTAVPWSFFLIGISVLAEIVTTLICVDLGARLIGHYWYAGRIKPTNLLSIRFSFDSLLCLLCFATFAASLNPFSFFAWVLFGISTIQSLRTACISDTRIRKYALEYRRFVYRDDLLSMPSMDRPSAGASFRTYLAPILKAPIILFTLAFKYIEKFEKKADARVWVPKFQRVLLICLYSVIFLGCLISSVYVFLGLASFHAQIDVNTWSFGQIVAITVWVPPLCEYFHLEQRGMTAGFQHRLLPPYKVVRTENTARPRPIQTNCENAEGPEAEAEAGALMVETEESHPVPKP